MLNGGLGSPEWGPVGEKRTAVTHSLAEESAGTDGGLYPLH